MAARKTPLDRRTKRQAKLAKERAYTARVATANRFPRIVVEPGAAPEPFVLAVKDALKRVRFGHEELLPGLLALVFRDARDRGFQSAIPDLYRAAGGCLGLGEFAVNHFGLALGELMYREIPAASIRRYTPFHCVDLHYGRPRSDQILASFRSLLSVRTTGGTAYFSRRKPTLPIVGSERIVAFSRHAIERICERTVGDWTTFAGGGDAFAFLDNCVYFEPCDSPSGEPLFTFFNDCTPGYFSFKYAQEVAGVLDSRRQYAYRVGYCPAVVEGDLIKAKTLLTPGMRGTPEYEVLMKSPLPGDMKREMAARAGRLSFRDLSASGDFSLLRWFHEQGVPQVVALGRDIFEYC